MNLNKIILKHKIINALWDLLSYSVVIILAYILNRPYELFVYVISYTFIRAEFSKAVHGKDFTSSYVKGIIYCRLITMVVQAISIILLISVDISRYVNVLMGISLGIFNFFAKDYLEYHLVKTNLWLMNEQILEDLCVKHNLTDLAKNRLRMRYIEKKKIREIADIEKVEVESIEEFFRKLKKRLK